LRRRGKNYDASTWRRRRRRRKKWRKSTNFQQKFVWFTYSKNNLTRKQIMRAKRSMSRWCNCSPSPYRKLKKNWHELLRENKNNIERTDWKLRRVVKKFEDGIEEVNHDAVETSSKNLIVSLKRSTRSTSDTTGGSSRRVVGEIPLHFVW